MLFQNQLILFCSQHFSHIFTFYMENCFLTILRCLLTECMGLMALLLSPPLWTKWSYKHHAFSQIRQEQRVSFLRLVCNPQIKFVQFFQCLYCSNTGNFNQLKSAFFYTLTHFLLAFCNTIDSWFFCIMKQSIH